MEKTSILATLVFSAILVLSPLAVAASTTSSSNSTFYYIPQDVWTQATPSGVSPLGIPLCGTGSGTLVCYSPSFIKTAYDYPTNLNGSGQTIVIVDAYGSPTITQDLATFDSYFGLPAPPSFTILCANSCPSFNPGDKLHDVVGWGVETSLDVEWAHAMAPGANIVLVVAASSSGNAINVAETKALGLYPHAIFSQSFGIPEGVVTANNAQILQAEKNYAAMQAANDTVLASAGDFGATNSLTFANAGFPASDPLVTSVGGTQGLPYNASGTLQACGSGQTCTSGLATYTGPCTFGRTVAPNCTPTGYGAEQVWNEPDFGAATGGAPSLFFPVPSYQSGLGLSSRTTPDISYNAAVDGGVLVKASFLSSAGYFVVGGTSAGSPQWAAIFALVDQQRALNGEGPIGFANPALYSLTSTQKANDFHDITVGNNQLAGTPVGFNATSGYDDASGWGTPVVSNLVTDLS